MPPEPPSIERDKALIQAGMVLASELSLDAVLQRIVELAVDITGARYGALGVLTPDRRSIEEFITVGVSPEQRAAIGDPPVGHGILGILIEEAGPLRIANIADDPRSVGFPPNHPPMRSFLGAPVVARNTVFGNIYLTEKGDADGFSEHDQEALVVLAAQAGIALENARLYEEAQLAQRGLSRLQLLEERERIAKELHDGVIQSLFAVGMGLQATAAATQDEAVSHRLEGAVEEVDRAIRDLRNYIFGLRPGILADRQLDQAIQQLARDFEISTGVVTIVDVDSEVASALASKSAEIVQLTKEALSNVGRHAEATTCRITLRREGDSAAVIVDDDGIGFDLEEPRSGMGLANLEERVSRTLGGTFRIDSAEDQGTTVHAVIPLL